MDDNSEKLRAKAKEELRQGKIIDTSLYETDMKVLVEELSIYQIELEHQNQELIQSQELLQQSKNRYLDLFDNAPIGYLIVDINGLIIDINQTAAKLLERSKNEFVDTKITKFIHPDYQDIYYLYFQTLIHQKHHQPCDIKVRKANNSFFYARIQGVCQSGKIDHEAEFRLAISDISIQKEMEIKLLAAKSLTDQSEERYRLLADNIPDIIYSLNGEGNIVTINSSTFERYGYTEQDAKGAPFLSFVYPDDRDIVLNSFYQALQEQRIYTQGLQFRIAAKDGDIHWLELNSKARFNNNGAYLGEDGVLRDITERKIAEKALEESEDRLSTIFKNDPTGILIVHEKTRIIYDLNDAASKVFGLQKEEIIGRECHSFLCAAEKGCCPICDLGQKLDRSERFLLKTDGTSVPILKSVVPIVMKGESYLLESFIDISEVKKAEKILAESERRFRELLSSVEMISVILDLEGTIVFCNDYFLKLTGWMNEEVVGKNWFSTFLSSEILVEVSNIFYETVFNNNIQLHYENSILTKNGENILVSWNNTALYDENGKLSSIASLGVDITERKKAEEALRKSKEIIADERKLLRTLIDNLPDFIYIKDVEGRKVISNIADYTVLGLQTEDQILGKTDLELFPDGTGKRGYENDMSVIRTGNAIVWNEEDFVTNNGVRRWVLTTKTPLYDSDGKVIGLVGIGHDITERKKAEQALNESRKMLELVMNCIPQVVFWKDRNSVYLGSNKNFARAAGLNSAVDIVGKTDYDMPWKTEEADFFVECDKRVMNSGKGEYHIVEPQLQADGKQAWLETNKVPILDENGEVIGILGTYEDITQRLQADVDLQASKDYLDKIINSLVSPIFVKDENHNFCLVNKALCKLLNLTDNDLIGKTGMEHFPDDQRKVFLAKDNEVLNTGIENVNEEKLTDGTGKVRTIITNKSLYIDNEGNKFLVGVINDITERKNAEEKVVRIGQHYQALIEKAPDGIALIDAEGNFKYISPSARKMFGYTLTDEIVGNPAEFTHPDDLPKVLAELGKIFADPTYIPTIEYRFINKQGNWLWVETTFSNLLANESVESIALNFRDITERKKAEADLSESEDRNKAILSAIPDLMFSFDTNGVFIDYQSNNKDGLYLDSHFFIGKNIFDVLPQEIAVLTQSKLDILFQSGETQIYHYELEIDKDLKDFESRLVLCGEKKALSIVRDITERKKAEEALKESESTLKRQNALFNSLIRNLPMGVFMVDALSGKPLLANEAALTLLGRGILPDANKHNLHDVYEAFKVGSTEKYPIDEMPIIRGMKGESSRIDDMLVIRPDGTESLLEVYGSPVKDEDGNIWASLVSFMDITERKKAEVALHESEEKFREMANLLPQIIFESDNTGCLTYVNKNAFSIFGYPDDYPITGKNSLDFYAPESRKRAIENINKIITGNQRDFSNEYEMLKSDGTTFPVLIYSNPIIKDGVHIGLRGIIVNIAEQKQIEQELITAKDHAEESDRLKSAFLANMSHEIRTPMNGILGFADLLKDTELTGEEQQEYIAIIEKSGVRMLNIINEIIDISKIEAGLMKLDLEQTNINEQIEYIYTFFKPEVEAKGMVLKFHAPLTAQEATITADREKVYAILTNLVKNAIKYTNNGSIEFGYKRIVETRHALSLLQFYVKDTGIGIPKERQEAIFERFIQSDVSDVLARQGAGLGLAISKAYVEMLGGTIWVESEVSAGSTFYFTLPFHDGMLNDTAIPQVLPSGVSKTMKKLKILIAEDDEISALLLDKVAKLFSDEVLKARTGVEAIALCKQHPDIDLVLMDIRMPEMTGYEATRQIRAFDQKVVIIAQTAYGLSGDREKAIEAGCTDYIAKPINKELLSALILKYCAE